MIPIIVPTRNNSSGLACLLANLVGQADPDQKLDVIVVDSSDSLAINDALIRRVWPCVNLHYHYDPEMTDVNDQRLAGMAFTTHRAVFFMDDDILPLAGFRTSLYRCSEHLDVGCTAIFGCVVDATNERGYPDYGIFGDKPDNHRFFGAHEEDARTLSDDDLIVEYLEFGDGKATPGFMLALKDKAQESLVALQALEDDPAVVDDAWATWHAINSGYPLCPTLSAWHIGNENQWFVRDMDKKRKQVRELLRAFTL